MEKSYLHEKDMTPEEALAHFGVKGMHWGVRRARDNGGLSRYKAAKVQANDRMIRARQKASTGIRAKVIPGFKKQQERGIKKLQASTERIQTGKTKVRDMLNIYSTVGISDLLFVKTAK